MARIADLLAEGRTFSFEFFPPRTDAAQLSLGRTIAELEPLGPSFVSVTYGAGGSTRQRTHEVVAWVRRETGITPMAHLTCAGHRRDEIAQILESYQAAGIENILALGGDPPRDQAEIGPSDYAYAAELVADVRASGPFSVGVAAHPELHPRSASRDDDRRYLAAKLSAADFAITQFFFDRDHYLRLVDELAALGVSKPVLPGIMPVTNKGQVIRMAELSGAVFPAWLAARLEPVEDPDDVRRIGVEVGHRAVRAAARRRCARAALLHLEPLQRDPRDLRQPGPSRRRLIGPQDRRAAITTMPSRRIAWSWGPRHMTLTTTAPRADRVQPIGPVPPGAGRPARPRRDRRPRVPRQSELAARRVPRGRGVLRDQRLPHHDAAAERTPPHG